MTRTHIRIALLNHVGQGNIGDDATLAAVIHNTKMRCPQAQIIAITLNPRDTQKQHGIVSYPMTRNCKAGPVLPASGDDKERVSSRLKAALRKHPILMMLLRFAKAVTVRIPCALVEEPVFLIKALRITSSINLLIIGGGGQLRDSYRGKWRFPRSILKLVILAKLSGVPCYFLDLGAGPLKTWSGRLLIRYALYLSDYSSFRDERSCRLIQGIGFTGNSVVAADCVYSLPIPSNTITRQRPESGNSSVGISPMQVYWEGNPEVYSHLIQEMAGLCSWLLRGPYRLQLFGTDVWYDSRAVADLRRTTVDQCPIGDASRITCPSIHSFSALLAQMATMDYVVTCRFRGVVFAHLLNIPVLALSHHPKVATQMNDIGLSEYCVDIAKFDSGQLIQKFSRLVETATDIRRMMAERAVDYQKKLTLQFDSLFPVGLDQWSPTQLRQVLRQARDSGKVRAKYPPTACVPKGVRHNDYR